MLNLCHYQQNYLVFHLNLRSILQDQKRGYYNGKGVFGLISTFGKSFNLFVSRDLWLHS